MSEVVLDASAVLAFLNAETGADRVEQAILQEHCLLLSVNYTEVLSRLADWQVPLADARALIDALELEYVPFDMVLAQRAAELRPLTRVLGLSLGDRACLALGASRKAGILCADRAWRLLDLGISVECIRPDATPDRDEPAS